MTERATTGAVVGTLLPRLIERYTELAEACYRVATSRHDERGRFRKGHAGRRPHPVLLKKIDLDRELFRLYRKFFSVQPEWLGAASTSTSNRRRQGKETRTGSGAPPETREA